MPEKKIHVERTHSSSIIEAQMSILAAEPPGEAG
jgi:hypothetical protein